MEWGESTETMTAQAREMPGGASVLGGRGRTADSWGCERWTPPRHGGELLAESLANDV
jgi:hypothetical protein